MKVDPRREIENSSNAQHIDRAWFVPATAIAIYVKGCIVPANDSF